MVGLPERDGSLTPTALQPALEAIGRADAVVLGPGIGKDKGAQELARELVERIDVPLVVDADGLNALAGGAMEELVRVRPWPTVMTPHAGELGRMLGVDSKEIGRHRLRYAREAAAKAKAIIVLKGDDTLVATPNGRVAVSRGHAPALATAGTGDVLSGVIGAMLAKGLAPAHAACRRRLRAPARGPDRRRARRARRRDRLRRDPRAARRPGKLSRACCARWPGSTWARSSATRARLAAVAAPAALCAVVKADGYGHGMVPAARAAQAGGASWLAVATARGGARAARGGHRGPGAGDGRAVARGARGRAGGAGRRGGLARGFVGGGCRRGARASTSSSTPAWGGSARATPRRPRAWPRRSPRATGCGSSGAMTHFATADDDPAFVAEQLAAFTPWARGAQGRAPGRARPRRQLGGDAARARRALRPRPLRDRGLRHGPVPGGPGRARPRAGAVAASPTSPRPRPPRRARAPATAAASSPRRRPASARCRSATATACGAR